MLRNSSCKMHVARYMMQNSGCKTQVASNRMQVAICKLRKTSWKIQVMTCGLQDASCLFQVARYKLQDKTQIDKCNKINTDWRESRFHLSLETKSTETLGLVPVSYKIFEVVSSRGLVSDEKISDSFVSVLSRLLQFYSVSSRSRPDLYV